MALDIRRWGIGLIGYGGIAETFAAAIHSIPNARLVAVAGRNEEKARGFAAKEGCEAAANHHELLSRDDIDIVCVTTSSGSHAEYCSDAIRAGKHVFVEKPLAVSTQDASALVGMAESHGVTFTSVCQRRFEAHYVSAKKAVDEGKLGKLLLIEALSPLHRTQDYYDSAPWRVAAGEGGGALMNQGIHLVDLMLWFGGEPRTVYGKISTQIHTIEPEDMATAIVAFENGAMGTVLSTTNIHPGFPPTMKIYGERGTIIVEGNSITYWNVPDTAPPDKPDEASLEGANDPKVGFENHRDQLLDFIQAIEEGRNPSATAKDGYHAVKLVNLVYESSKLGRELNWTK
jgi:UDP-N-acetyl-2-amino-2-deoxyglucuronate dehydrogenase